MRKTNKKGFIFKVDFEKGFDSLNWEYLIEVWGLGINGVVGLARV